jgi:hypothetical protein
MKLFICSTALGNSTASGKISDSNPPTISRLDQNYKITLERHSQKNTECDTMP